MADVNTVAEPSAAAAIPAKVQFDNWDEHGNPIVSKSPEPPKKDGESAAPATPAKETKPEPEGKSEAEPGTAPKQEKKERKPGEKLSAEERISQLTAEIKTLKAERERSRPADTKPPVEEKKPAAVEQKYTRAKPTADDKGDDGSPKYKSYEDFIEDLSDWKAEQREVKLRAELQQQAQRQKVETEFAEAKKLYPDFEEKSKPIIDALTSDPDIPEAFKAAVGTSDVFTHLVYALSEQQAEQLFDLAKTNAIKAVMKLGVLEDAVRSELAKDSKEKPKAEEKTDETPPAKPQPRAPKPPAEVGGRGTAPADEQAEAARTGNFAAFEAAERRRKFAKQA